MGHSNGFISEPVNTDDIGAVLGYSSHNVKTLCMDLEDKINPWAKWKPENFEKVEPLTLEDRRNNNFGLRPNKVYQGLAVVTALRGGTFDSNWRYAKVTAAGTGRMTDFLSPDYTQGYNANATHPFPQLKSGTAVIYGPNQGATTIQLMLPFIGTDSVDIREFNLQNAELESGTYDLRFGKWYFGLILFNETNLIVASCANRYESEGQWEVNFGELPLTYEGTYTAVPVLSQASMSTQQGWATTITSGNRIVGLGSNGVEMRLIKSSNAIKFVAFCAWDSSKTHIEYQVIIENDTSTARTFSFVELLIMDGQNFVDSDVKTTTIEWQGGTISAGGKWSKSGRINKPVGFKTSRTGYCRVTAGGLGTSNDTPFGETFKPVTPPIHTDPIV